jgi:hypothetical protein
MDDLDDQHRLQKFYKRPWWPSNSKSEKSTVPPLATKSNRASAVKSVSPKPGPSKERTPEPSSNADPAPLIVPQEVRDVLSSWMTKGVLTEDSKTIS